MQTWKGYLRLMRPANIVTAISDILAGAAIAGYFTNSHWAALQVDPILLLVLATIGLYGGGVVFNDVFDADLDKVERPERPIPSGLIDKQKAAVLGSGLILMAIIAAYFVHHGFYPSCLIAIAIAVAALTYDKWGKHHAFLGPLNMGLCRGGNILLGMSVLPAAISEYWFIGIIPVIYISAITMISRGEVHGGKKSVLMAAAIFYLLVISSILFIAYYNSTTLRTLFFLLLFGGMIFLPLQKAMRYPSGPSIGKAVKAGVLALIVLNASWAVAFGTVSLALVILMLLPVSIILAKAFAVT
ncbi:UbiA-like protein EboC [Flavisolibacter tropicus]|uniref:Polyprenyltransferase n=1 Tax=Flavisolibacter tropicus TaxID=1492898 RepID=A0A172U304_9BACT|nr:UbiA-like protein EboC [Flavisolibacter tropicus]ANE53413.1 polyprenyltransferase [Flavisolibacter tropicus]